MNQIYESIEELFEDFAESLDLSPTQLNRAIVITNNLSKWISSRDFNDGANVKVYTQGSMRLGTTVKPYKKEKDKEYDVDIVAEILNPSSEQQCYPKLVKFLVKNRIIDNKIYKDKLIDKESRLCWKLLFEPERTVDGEVCFHIDVLPAISQNIQDLSILHPVKDESDKYSWKLSNPQKFADWFDSLNMFSGKQEFYEQYRKKVHTALSESMGNTAETMSFKEAVEIPDTFVRTPLQRAVQLLKRNRDVFTANSKMKIDSIIITRLAAGLYHGELTAYKAYTNIVHRLLKYKQLFIDMNFSALNESGNFLEKDLITRRYDEKQHKYLWVIENPCNPFENYAIRWHENDNAQAKFFFSWLDKLGSALQRVETYNLAGIGPNFLEPNFGEKVSKEFLKSYGENVQILRESKRLKDSSSGLSTKSGNTIQKHNFWG